MGSDPTPADRVVAGRYALVGVLGRGGMGVVWLAQDRVLERRVAIKEITYSLTVSDEERQILRERTMREARAAAKLDHPNVAAVYDVVEENGKPWLVMAHVAARSLQDILEAAGPLPPAEVARIGLDVLAALEAAHQAGIVHRDVKPANVLVEPDGSACLTDFGIATTTGDSSLTTRGAFIGSPSYMAPERTTGEPPGPSVDLWSLGATLYAAVEGRPPFDRGDPMATLMSVVSDEPPPAERAGALDPVLRGLLIKDPARRSSADQARRQLEAALSASAPGVPASVAASPPTAPLAAVAPARAETAGRGGSAARFDMDDLRSLAAKVGDVARDARAEARLMADQRRDSRASREPQLPAPRGRARFDRNIEWSPAAPLRGFAARRGWRFKRRWVLVPLLVVVALTVALVAGLMLLGRMLGTG